MEVGGHRVAGSTHLHPVFAHSWQRRCTLIPSNLPIPHVGAALENEGRGSEQVAAAWKWMGIRFEWETRLGSKLGACPSTASKRRSENGRDETRTGGGERSTPPPSPSSGTANRAARVTPSQQELHPAPQRCQRRLDGFTHTLRTVKHRF